MKKGFPSIKIVESVIKHCPDIIDPKTGHPLQVVMWSATNQVKQIPVLQSYQDGSRSSMLYWVFDETTAFAVIKLKDGYIRLYDQRDLFQFRKWDIHHLIHHQIKVVEDIFEPSTKEYTFMVADIINKRIWNRETGQSEVMVVDKD